jgi:hypothetical protein
MRAVVPRWSLTIADFVLKKTARHGCVERL